MLVASRCEVLVSDAVLLLRSAAMASRGFVSGPQEQRRCDDASLRQCKGLRESKSLQNILPSFFIPCISWPLLLPAPVVLESLLKCIRSVTGVICVGVAV